MKSLPVPVIELFRDDDGGYLLVMPLVESSEDLEMVDSLEGYERTVTTVRLEDGVVSLPVYARDGHAYVTWDDAFPVS